MAIKVRKNNQWVTVATASLGTGTTKVAQLWDEKTSGTNGGTFTTGSWVDRTLNEENDPQDFVTLESGNVSFSLLSGTYRITWSAPANNVHLHKTQLVYSTNSDFSAGVTSIQGSSGFDSSNMDPNSQTRSFGDTQLTITAKTYFKIQHRCTVQQLNYGLGGATGLAAEVYTQVAIEDLTTAAGAGGGGGGVTDGDKGDITVTNSGQTWTIDNDVIEEKHINAGGTAANGKLLKYDSTHATNWSWTDPGATVTTSDSPPASPSDGDLWWNSTTGILNVYYEDTDSSQWVNATGRAGGSTAGKTKVARIYDRKPSSDGAGSPDTYSAWRTRTLNYKDDLSTFVTLESSLEGGDKVFSLPAGSYSIKWRAPAHDGNNMRTRLRYDTNSGFSSPTDILGESGISDTASSESNYYSCGSYFIDITQKTYFVVQQYQDAGNWGQQSQIGDYEIYTQVFIEDLATAIKEPTGTDIPVGGIIMYSGTQTELNALTNWKLCDGNNGTPNLKDKFVIGADQYSSGWKTNVTGSLTDSGGSKDAVVVQHNHDIGNWGGSFGGTSGATVFRSDSSGTNTTIIQDEGVSGTNQNLPPYFALAYIMRTS